MRASESRRHPGKRSRAPRTPQARTPSSGRYCPACHAMSAPTGFSFHSLLCLTTDIPVVICTPQLSEVVAEPRFDVTWLVEAHLQQRLNARLRRRTGQRRHERVPLGPDLTVGRKI